MNKKFLALILVLIVSFYFTFQLLTNKSTTISYLFPQEKEQKYLNISIWTFLTDYQGYAVSAIKLIKSIKNNTSFSLKHFFVLEIKEKPLSEKIKKQLFEAGWAIKTVSRIPPRDERKTIQRFRDQFTKLELWAVEEYEANIYFDSDTVVVGNIDAFLSLYKNFVSGKHKIGVTRDLRYGKWQTSFNMGVFVIKPNRTEYEYLIGLKNDESFKFETKMSEQGFLNEVYKNKWYEIGFENNANLAVYTQKKDYWLERENDIKIIHFTMQKPWSCGGVYQKVCALWEKY